MAEPTRTKEEDDERDQSTRPANWPGIPGRSREHEASPEGEAPARGDAEVTEAQRALEREGER